MNKNIIKDSINCLAKAQLEDATYEIARDITLDYLKELEEENKKLKDKVLDLSNHLALYSSEETMLKEINSLQLRIDKAIEYIENDMPYLEEPDEEFERCDGTTYMTTKEYDKSILLKIMKGEE